MKHFFKAALVSCIGVSLLSIPVKASWKGSLAEEVGTRAIPYFSRSLSRGFIPTSRSSFLLESRAPYQSTHRVTFVTRFSGEFSPISRAYTPFFLNKRALLREKMAVMDEIDILRGTTEEKIKKIRKEAALKLLLTKMMSDEQIQEVAGLSPEELAELKSKIKPD